LWPVWLLDKEPALVFEKEELKAILQSENELRLSPEIQEMYSNLTLNESAIDADGNLTELFRVDEDIIRRNLSKCGYKPDTDESLAAYRIATGKYLEDSSVKNYVVWMKYDFMKLGKLRAGKFAPNCQLHRLPPLSISAISSASSTSSASTSAIPSAASPAISKNDLVPLFDGNDGRPIVLIGGSFT